MASDTQVNINLEVDKEDVSLDDVEEEVADKNQRGRLRSTVSKTDESGRKIKGRGFGGNSDDRDAEERYAGKAAEFEQLDDPNSTGPLRSVEGYIVFVTGVHEEASEDDIHDKFSEFGEVKNLHLPLDRRTGFVKGYALVEYETKEEAEEVIKAMDNTEFMENTIHVDWAFSKGPSKTSNKNRTGRGAKRYTRNY